MRSTIALALVSLALALPAAAANSGRARDLRVEVPRVESDVQVDGVLDEPVWAQAARLTEFSDYAPVDGRPAEDDTEVLVWYSPHAIHFGIRAHAAPGSVRATLANRDRIDAEDSIQIFLSTFNDGRQAVVFGMNPFGVQADGALSEGTRQTSGGFSGLVGGREQTDLSPDYVYDSKGRLTDYGYELEVRIPFKTLRYPSTGVQDWGLHVIRKVQSRGHEDSWAPAIQSGTSFLRQAGTLAGLQDLRRGLALDLNPVVTAKADGARRANGTWGYGAGAPEFGGNVRWGVTSNLTMNGTINPDFSQVEADAGQFVFDPRSALYFPEKRPFFLDGIEQFDTPNRLIYTRRIVAPLAAAKFAGKVSGTTVATLVAVDDAATSISREDHPLVAVARVQRDIGGGSRAAFVYTDRADGAFSNRVFASDVRFTFAKLYTVQAQGAVSRTAGVGSSGDVGAGSSRPAVVAPLWDTRVERNGRHYGFRYSFSGISPDFSATNGLIQRGAIVHAAADNRVSIYGPANGLLQRLTSDVVVDGIWDYSRFTSGSRSALEKKLHFNNNASLRGGWSLGWSWLVETFAFDPTLYTGYAVEHPGLAGPVYVPFAPLPSIDNLDYVLTVATPDYSTFSADAFVLWGRDENFYEWSPADIAFVRLNGSWRPTGKLRVEPGYQLQQYKRRSDGSTVGVRKIPRLKIEYQLSRAVFVRAIGEYDANRQDTLRDDSRTNLPIVVRNQSTGVYERRLAFERNRFRLDWLFSYQPTPGPVVFAGYGNTLAEPQGLAFRDLRRVNDGFFVKLSYLFRM